LRVFRQVFLVQLGSYMWERILIGINVVVVLLVVGAVDSDLSFDWWLVNWMLEFWFLTFF